MIYKEYDIYKAFKEVEGEVKGKEFKILAEAAFAGRISAKNFELIKKVTDLFNTRFSNVNLKEYLRCGFHHFKSFDYDKVFREIVLNEYIARDARNKRNIKEPISKILSDMKYINRPLDYYLREVDGNRRVILTDYIQNNIGSTIVVYCIWRNLFKPTEEEWEYMSNIKNNYPAYETNVVKFAGMIDKWKASMKERK